MTARTDERVLVLAPTAGDAAITRSILGEAGLLCHVCDGLLALGQSFDEGAGAILLTEEALTTDDSQALAATLQRQPPWSDVPLLLLCHSGADSLIAIRAMEQLGNVTVLEQPVRVTTLVSALRTALKARRRQYELRNRMESLRYQLDLTRTITDNATTAIFMMDDASRCTFMNPAAEAMTGFTFEEARGQILHDLIHHHRLHGDPYPLAECPIDRALPEQYDVVGHEDMLIRKSGEFLPVLVNAKPIRRGGVAVGTVVEVRDLTERRQAEERERQLLVETATANAQFRALFEQGALFAGIMHVDGTILEPNRVSVEACGYTREQVIGKPFWECPWWNGSTHLMEQIKQASARAATGELARAELPYFVADGSQRILDLILLPIKDQAGRVLFLAPTGTDVTDRKRAEQAMLLSSQQLRHLAQVATQINVAHDLESVLGVVTAEARNLIGAHQATATLTSGKPGAVPIDTVSLSNKYAEWQRLDRPQIADGIGALVGRAREPMRLTQAELEAHPARAVDDAEAGRSRPPLRGWLAVPLVGRDGSNLGLIQLSDKYEGEFTENDESILVQLARIASVAIENARLYEELQAGNRRKDEFLATLAHELRNPLAPIRSGLELLRLVENDPALVEEIRTTMEGQTRQLVRLVDDLLDVSRITSGKITLRKERVELGDVVRSAVEATRAALDEAGHQLAVHLPAEAIMLDADPTRLAQILSNLLTNAAKYSEPGGRIRITAETSSGVVTLSISDTGIGIPAGMLDRIFEMFTQVDQTLEKSHSGLGIGLTLVKRLIEMHGGAIAVRSEGAGKGSEFSVRLPVVQGAAGPAAAASDSEQTPSGNLRVLVVDDNRDAARMLAMVVKRQGNATCLAHDGLEALELAAAFRPHVVLMDIGMPRLNGYEAASRMRGQAWGENLLLVALTGWGQAEDRQRTKQAGFDHHLVKPVEPAALRKLLADFDPQRP